MKRVLSFLLMIVFMQAQVSTVFAKHGGPDIGDGNGVDTIGSYAGTLTPIIDPTAESSSSSNSIGLFGLGVPQIGVAQGTCVLFVEGAAYEGTITAVADPLDGELQGLILRGNSMMGGLLLRLTFTMNSCHASSRPAMP